MTAAEFPIYRKYPNELSFFRIHSPTLFTELKIIGRSYTVVRIEAQNHFDHLFIADMRELRGGHWEASSEEEFDQRMEHCRANFKELSGAVAV